MTRKPGTVRPGRVHGQRGRADRFERNDRRQLPEQPEEPRPTVETARQCGTSTTATVHTTSAKPRSGRSRRFRSTTATCRARWPTETASKPIMPTTWRAAASLVTPTTASNGRPVHRLRAEHVPADRPPGLELRPPAEVEVEHHLVNNFADGLIRAGVVFPFVRWCNPGNSQENGPSTSTG